MRRSCNKINGQCTYQSPKFNPDGLQGILEDLDSCARCVGDNISELEMDKETPIPTIIQLKASSYNNYTVVIFNNFSFLTYLTDFDGCDAADS